MASNDFNASKQGQHNGYGYKILKKEGVGQAKYIAMAESLSIKTDVFANEKDAEECIKDLISKSYDATFNKSGGSKNVKPQAASQAQQQQKPQGQPVKAPVHQSPQQPHPAQAPQQPHSVSQPQLQKSEPPKVDKK